jgi:hypothetical protein
VSRARVLGTAFSLLSASRALRCSRWWESDETARALGDAEGRAMALLLSLPNHARTSAVLHRFGWRAAPPRV